MIVDNGSIRVGTWIEDDVLRFGVWIRTASGDQKDAQAADGHQDEEDVQDPEGLVFHGDCPGREFLLTEG